LGVTRHSRAARGFPPANDSDEGGQPIARCTLRGTLVDVWPTIAASQS
jgi:hypothetical protein